MRDTIFALSSGAPPAGVAVIRISGPGVRFGLETIVGYLPEPRVATLARLSDQDDSLLDRGLVLYFPAPASFTGEDVAELQIHGGRASVSAVLECLSKIPGYRLAEPGEYTKRAFENNQMDLTAVEGLSDLIRAETEEQRRQALDQAGGVLKKLYGDWAQRITHARAMVEAELDFSDEDDIPGSVSDMIWADMVLVAQEVEAHLSSARTGEMIRDGFRVALIGAPNAGKSSLLNVLAQRDVAIVSDIPGTTRDVVEIRLDIKGHLVLIQDTAGVRDSDDGIEQEGIRRSLAAAESADLVLELRDARSMGVESEAALISGVPSVIIWTKSDLMSGADQELADNQLLVSSLTGMGIESLLSLMAKRITDLKTGSGELLPTRTRHKTYLQQCSNALKSAIDGSNLPVELRTEYLREAATSLGRITGNVDVEDLLGVIFSEFCVGK